MRMTIKSKFPARHPLGASHLGSLRRGAKGHIVGIVPLPDKSGIDPAELERRLLEMGFVEGAEFEILHEGPVGGDPIAVRLDETRVALRRRDAMALRVTCEAS